MHRGHGAYTSTAHCWNKTAAFETNAKITTTVPTGPIARAPRRVSPLPLMRNDTILSHTNVGRACAALTGHDTINDVALLRGRQGR